MPTPNLRQAVPQRIADIIDLDGPSMSDRLWRPEELGAILRHRLNGPSDFGQAPTDASATQTASSSDSRSSTLGHLLSTDSASLTELRRVIEFARASRRDRDAGLPPEVSTLLFLTAAAATTLRHGTPTGIDLSDGLLLSGFRWASRQSWGDEAGRVLCHDAAERLVQQGITPAPLPDGALPPLSGDPQAATPAPPVAAANSPVPDVPGYRILGHLGEGGMGTVWRAVQLSTRREVALKLVSATAIGSHRARLRFDREVQIAARLQHPNIARVHDSGSARGIYYYAMELVEGTHLDRFAADQHLEPRQILSLMREVCLAVQYAHQKGVIHRDLKPANILVDTEGHPKVVDFGLAKALDDERDGLTLTLEGQWAGTPAFMAPEQAAGATDKLDTRTDVYGLGATLYLLLTGQSPHDVSGPRYAVMNRIAKEEVRPPRQAMPDLDLELEAILLKALARDHNQRYASPGELAKDLANYLDGEPLVARPPTPLYVLRKRLRKNWFPISVSSGVLILLFMMGFWSYAREAKQRRLADGKALEASIERQAAVNARIESELSLAQAKLAEGDALITADEIGQAKDRYEEARQVLERNGQSTFAAELALWDAHRKSPPPLMEFVGHDDLVTCIAFLKDGRRLLSGSEDGTLRLWDAITGRCIRVITGAGSVQRLSLAPDGQTVAVAGLGGGLTLWEIETGRKVGVLDGMRGEPTAVAFSHDGKHLLVGTSDLTDNAYLFDAGTRKQIRTFKGHAAGLRAVAFSPDGEVAITASGRPVHDRKEFEAEAGVRAWNVADGRQLWRADAGAGRFVADVAVSPDGATVIAGTWRSRAFAWSTKTGEQKWEVDAGDEVHGVAFSPDGNLCAAATGAGKVEIRWSATGEQLDVEQHRTFRFGGQRAVAFAPDARFLAAADGKRIRFWPLLEAGLYHDFSQAPSNPKRCPEEETFNVAFSPDGRLALSSTPSALVRLWDVATGWELGHIACGNEDEHAFNQVAAFIPNTQLILLAQADGSAGIWDLSLKRRLRGLEPWEDHKVRAVVVSPDGRHALLKFRDAGELQLYELAGGRRLRALDLGVKPSEQMAFSPDSKLVAAAGDQGPLKLWEASSGRELHSWKTGPAIRIAFSPDGNLLACADATLQIFDTRSGASVPAGQWTVDLLALTFTPDGSQIMVGAAPTLGAAYSLRSLATGNARNLMWGTHVFDFAWHTDPLRLLAAQRTEWGNARLLELSYPARLRSLQPQASQATQQLAKDAADHEALRILGEWYAFRGVWDYAAQLLEAARAAGCQVSPLLLGRCYWMDLNFSKATEEFKAAITAAKDVAEASYLSLCLDALNRCAGEFHSFDLYGKHPYYLISLRLLANKPQRALDLVRAELAVLAGDAHALDIFSFSIRDRAGIAVYQLGDLEAAKRCFLDHLAIELEDPAGVGSYGSICGNLADTTFRLGEFDQSVQWYEKALPSYRSGEYKLGLRIRYGDALWHAERREAAIEIWKGVAIDVAAGPPVASEESPDLDLKARLERRLSAVGRGETPPLEFDIRPSKDPYDSFKRLAELRESHRARWRRDIERQLQARSIEVAQHPQDPQLRADRGFLYARLGRFNEAAVEYQQAMDRQPAEEDNWHRGLAALLQCGDVQEYQRRRSLELGQFAASTKDVAASVATDCLIWPIEGDELKRAVELAQRAVATDLKNLFFLQSRGMAEYRLAQYQEAIATLTQAADGRHLGNDLLCNLFVAMAHQRAGQETEARATLARTIQAIETQLPTPGIGDPYDSVGHWIFIQIARQQAEALIPLRPASGPAPQ